MPYPCGSASWMRFSDFKLAKFIFVLFQHMATTVDHLSRDHSMTVLTAFSDARGVAHSVGEKGVIKDMGYDWGKSEISITWERDGKSETMYFLDSNRAGPGNGRMKRFFELGEYVTPHIEGKKFVPFVGHVPLKVELPEVTASLITSDAQFDDAMTRIWALAGNRRFEEAEAQVRAIVHAEDRQWDNTDRAAGMLCSYALKHAFDDDLTVYQWLRERGISLWYAWGSGATSGGEGMARSVDIRAAERAFADLEKKLGRSA